jgi:hypothetical protein
MLLIATLPRFLESEALLFAVENSEQDNFIQRSRLPLQHSDNMPYSFFQIGMA